GLANGVTRHFSCPSWRVALRNTSASISSTCDLTTAAAATPRALSGMVKRRSECEWLFRHGTSLCPLPAGICYRHMNQALAASPHALDNSRECPRAGHTVEKVSSQYRPEPSARRRSSKYRAETLGEFVSLGQKWRIKGSKKLRILPIANHRWVSVARSESSK